MNTPEPFEDNKALHSEDSSAKTKKSSCPKKTANSMPKDPPKEKRHEPFARAAHEDDDGYDPWSDRVIQEPFWEKDPWS